MPKRSSNKTKTIGELVHKITDELYVCSSSPRLDAELIVAHYFNLTRTKLLTVFGDLCSEEQCIGVELLIERRKKHEPIAYIMGTKEFWGLEFNVTPDVLIPRPESELLIEEALKVLRDKRKISFIDLGTGSGCLAIALLKELLKKGCVVDCTAVDLSSKALDQARSNANKHGVENFINFVESDWYSNKKELSGGYDLVLANPPYVDREESVSKEVMFEPEQAIYALDGGLKEVKKIILETAGYVKSGGVLLCEVGAHKREKLAGWFNEREENWDVEFLGDQSLEDRFCVVKVSFDHL